MSPTNAPELIVGAPDPAVLARFAADLSALCDTGRDRVLVAVSGGSDSVALLLLTHALLGERCCAATVDHGLRAESAGEAAFVGALCARLGVAHTVLRGDLPGRSGHTANLSARAREMRYALLERHAAAIGADRIATGHHADDQLETLIMRLNRGAGVGGLAGVRASSGRVIRPLLGWRRAVLAALVSAAGITPVEDPTNVDDRFDRARLRKTLAGLEWLDAERAAVSAAALADADAAIRWAVCQLETQRITADGDAVLLDPVDLPFEFRRRLAEICIARLDPDSENRGPALVRLVNALAGNEPAMLGNVTVTPEKSGKWRFAKAPPRRSL